MFPNWIMNDLVFCYWVAFVLIYADGKTGRRTRWCSDWAVAFFMLCWLNSNCHNICWLNSKYSSAFWLKSTIQTFAGWAANISIFTSRIAIFLVFSDQTATNRSDVCRWKIKCSGVPWLNSYRSDVFDWMVNVCWLDSRCLTVCWLKMKHLDVC